MRCLRTLCWLAGLLLCAWQLQAQTKPRWLLVPGVSYWGGNDSPGRLLGSLGLGQIRPSQRDTTGRNAWAWQVDAAFARMDDRLAVVPELNVWALAEPFTFGAAVGAILHPEETVPLVRPEVGWLLQGAVGLRLSAGYQVLVGGTNSALVLGDGLYLSARVYVGL